MSIKREQDREENDESRSIDNNGKSNINEKQKTNLKIKDSMKETRDKPQT